jgi:hypothetical protein
MWQEQTDILSTRLWPKLKEPLDRKMSSIPLRGCRNPSKMVCRIAEKNNPLCRRKHDGLVPYSARRWKKASFLNAMLGNPVQEVDKELGSNGGRAFAIAIVGIFKLRLKVCHSISQEDPMVENVEPHCQFAWTIRNLLLSIYSNLY